MYFIIAALFPVCALMALGWLLTRWRVLDDSAANGLNALLYWVLLPVQLVIVVGSADLRLALHAPGFAAAAVAFLIGLAVGWFMSGHLPGAQRGAVMNGVARANGAFVGLPIIALWSAAMANTATPDPDHVGVQAAYAVLLAGMVPLFNIGAVIAFLLPQHGVGQGAVMAVARELPRNPILIGCLAGVLMAWLAPGCIQHPPPWLQPGITALTMIAAGAVPLALLLTGSRLDLTLLLQSRRLLATVCLGKLLLMPALTWMVAAALGAGREATMAAVVLNACPSAMAAVAMARTLGADDRLLSAIIVATTCLSPLSLCGWLWALQHCA